MFLNNFFKIPQWYAWPPPPFIANAIFPFFWILPLHDLVKLYVALTIGKQFNLENFFGIVGKLVWFDHRFSRLSHLGGKDEHRSTTTNWNNFSGASHNRLLAKKGTFHIKILDLEGTVPQNRAAGAQFRLQADSSIKKRSKLSSWFHGPFCHVWCIHAYMMNVDSEYFCGQQKWYFLWAQNFHLNDRSG